MTPARIALVTGSAQGMGREHARVLSEAGWGLALCDRAGEPLRDVAAEIEERGGRVRAYVGDISADGFAQGIVEDLAGWGPIGGLVNNAGIGSPPVAITELSVEAFRSMFEVHVLGSLRCIQAALPGMLAEGFGRIVNVSSYCARSGSVGYTHYCTAKSAVIGMTRSLAREVAGSGVTVNAVAPGLIETPMTASDPPERREAAVAAIPVGRYGQPGEVAAMVRYLLSDEAGFVTGQVLGIDGGMVMG